MLVDYVRVYQDENDDYSHINIMQAEDCEYSSADLQQPAYKYSGLNNAKVLPISTSVGKTAYISTTDAVSKGVYDIYVTSVDTEGADSCDFAVNGESTGVSADFSENPGMRQHYAGTVKFTGAHKLSIGLTPSAKGADKTVLADAIILVANSKNTPTVTVDSDYDPNENVKTYEAESLTRTTNGVVTEQAFSDYGCGGNTFVIFDAPKSGTVYAKVGNYVEYTLPQMKKGVYALSVQNRTYGGRSIFDISVNGVVQSTGIDFFNVESETQTYYNSVDCGQISVTDSGEIKLRFTISTVRKAGFYMDKIVLSYIGGLPDDTESSTTATTTEIKPTEPTSTTQPTSTAIPTTQPTTSPTTVTDPTDPFTPVYGDVNEDGKVNTKDILLMRKYVANWDVTVNELNSDLNADGKINTKDVLMLRKHLAGWPVEFGK